MSDSISVPEAAILYGQISQGRQSKPRPEGYDQMDTTRKFLEERLSLARALEAECRQALDIATSNYEAAVENSRLSEKALAPFHEDVAMPAPKRGDY